MRAIPNSPHHRHNMSPRLTYLTELLATSPNDSFLLFAVAKEYEKSGDTPQATIFYEKIRAVDPSYVGLYYHLGKLHEQTLDIESAVAVYRQGIEVARAAGDRHAESELRGALLSWEDPD